MRAPRAAGGAVVLFALCVLAACTSSPEPAPAAPRPETSHPNASNHPNASTRPDPSSRPNASTGADTPSMPGTRTPGEPGPAKQSAYRQPLVLAVHRSRGDLDVSERLARRIVRGGPTAWTRLGQGPGRVVVRRGRGAVRVAVRDPDVVAVVPAAWVTPLVSATSVAGVDPLREPATYALTTTAAEEPATPTEVTVAGDIMLGRRVAATAQSRRDPGATLRPLQRRLASADLTVANLESTLSDDGFPRQGDDSFAADPAVLDALDDAGFDLLSLANNHVGDYGERAFRQTLRRFATSPIEQVGAGLDRDAAWRPVVLARAGVRFGFVAFNAIGETPAAGRRTPGAAQVRMQPRTGPLNAADLRRATRAIDSLDNRADVVVVLAHWGAQYTNVPVPAQRHVGRVLLDAGADLVVGGHPHWVQGVEVHRGGLIVHSLGNFVFDMDFSRETQEGALLEAVYWGDRLKAVDFVPYVIGPDFAPRIITGDRARAVLDRIAEASDPPFG